MFFEFETRNPKKNELYKKIEESVIKIIEIGRLSRLHAAILHYRREFCLRSNV